MPLYPMEHWVRLTQIKTTGEKTINIAGSYAVKNARAV